MKNKLLLFCIISSLSLSLWAQSEIETDLANIETTEQANDYIRTKPQSTQKIVVFNEEKHKTVLAKELFKMNKGGVKIAHNDYEKTYYKVIDNYKIPYYRVRYIYLNGNEMTTEAIETTKEQIVIKHKQGVPFSFLAKQYSMDISAKRGGDTGWFKSGTNRFEFENDVTSNTDDMNSIFTVEYPENQSYYVILKCFEPKTISEIKVLKIIEPIES